MMTLEEALVRLRGSFRAAVGTETVPLRAALGRVLAEDLVAGRDVPPHDNSAMDGYAVRVADLSADLPTRLPVTGRIAAGHPLDRPARPGEALRIFTGAPMPEGTDTVVMQEDVTLDGDHVILPPGIPAGANRRCRGEDVAAGTTIIPRGRLLRAQEIGLAASVGRSELPVAERLRAAVFSTGDELRDPLAGAAPPPGCVFDANRFTALALLEGLGCAVTDLGILPDDRAAMAKALAAAARGHHLIVTSGGVSEGEEDHVKAAVEEQGDLHFWKMAIKPGKPVALGRVGRAAFVGLPGNPVSAMVTFMLVGRAVALLLMGRDDIVPPRIPVRAGFSFRRKPGRREWLRVHLERDEDDGLVARKFSSEGSGILTSMVDSDGLVEVPEAVAVIEPGTWVDYISFSEVMR
ncbi:MAG: molybdopterin molybdotransferase MoeA [Magnetospirillum sp. WYHS-4]